MASSGISSSSSSSTRTHQIPPKSRLDNLKDSLNYCVSAEPEAVFEIRTPDGEQKKCFPIDTISFLALDEFFERAKEVRAETLEPKHGIAAMRSAMEKGVPDAIALLPQAIFAKAAITGSEELFRMPWQYGVRSLSGKEIPQVMAGARQLATEELKKLEKQGPGTVKDSSEAASPEDWKKWMTVLNIQMRNNLKRMDLIAKGYDRATDFLWELKKKVSQTREENLLAAEEKEKLALASPSKSKLAKKKARQKEVRAQRNLAEQQNILPKGLPSPVSTASPDSLLTQAEPPGGLNPNTFAESERSASQAPERTGTGKSKARSRTAARKRDQRSITQTTNRQQVLQSASLPAASGSSSVVTRSVPEPINAFAPLAAMPEDTAENFARPAENNPILEKLHRIDWDAITEPFPHPQQMAALNAFEALMRERWAEAKRLSEVKDSGVVIYSPNLGR